MTSNLSLLFLAFAKVALLTGIGPGILAAYFGPRIAKFWCPLSIGKSYRVEGYYTGDFVGEVESVDRDVARVRITDPMRPMPRVVNRCSFPECVRADFHNGEHEFMRVRAGVLLEVSWRNAKWTPNQVRGGAVSPSKRFDTSEVESWATSPPRKVRRRA